MESQIVEKDRLLTSVIQGRLDFFQSISVDSPLKGATFLQDPQGAVFYASGFEYAPLNGIFSTSADFLKKKSNTLLTFLKNESSLSSGGHLQKH